MNLDQLDQYAKNVDLRVAQVSQKTRLATINKYPEHVMPACKAKSTDATIRQRRSLTAIALYGMRNLERLHLHPPHSKRF